MKKSYVISLTLLLNFLCAFAQDLDVYLDKKIESQDGIELSADVYLPSGLERKVPTIFAFTPYTSDGVYNDARFFASNGYAVVIANCRGRGDSEGEFEPFVNDGKDGYAICQWIAKQDWSDGRVGMFGGSYVGMVQWLILKENPPSLKTAVPTATVCPGVDFPMQNNIFYTYNTQWLTYTDGNAIRRNMFVDFDYWNCIFEKIFYGEVPYCKLDSISGLGNDPNFQNWISHTKFDEFYKSILPDKSDYANINLPLLIITGHFDDDQRGTLHYYENYIKYASEDAKDKLYFVAGPWNHGGTRRPKLQYQNMTFDESSKLDMNELHLQWFDWIFKGADRPAFLKDKVACYEMQSDEWIYSPSLKDLSKSSEEFYLSSENSKASDVFNSGFLGSEQPKNETPDRFVYDPLDKTYSEYRLLDQMIDFSWREESESFAPDKLVYHSAPLKNDLCFTGKAKLEAYISMNVPDADFEAILYEIRPNGECLYLTSAFLRARFRNSLEKAELVRSGEVDLYEFDTFHFTSRKILKGSRIRLVVGALNSPYFQKNYCSGGDVSYETPEEAKKAEVQLWHNSDYPSKLTIPTRKK